MAKFSEKGQGLAYSRLFFCNVRWYLVIAWEFVSIIENREQFVQTTCHNMDIIVGE